MHKWIMHGKNEISMIYIYIYGNTTIIDEFCVKFGDLDATNLTTPIISVEKTHTVFSYC